jgi:glycosyltransferase involved in cell wall biosynthesis
MHILIVTPSLNQLEYLQRCVASVRDQVPGIRGQSFHDSSAPCTMRHAVSLHHHVQDAGSKDGSVDWLRQYETEVRVQEAGGRSQGAGDRGQGTGGRSQGAGVGPMQPALCTNSTRPEGPFQRAAEPRLNDSSSPCPMPHALCPYTFSYSSEPDAGMYDAVNRGWSRFAGEADIVAYLNCDEQFLEDALERVAQRFAEDASCDVLFGAALVVDVEGRLVCLRRPVAPLRRHILTNYLPVFTCATFLRSGVLRGDGLYFDTAWKDLGDVDWILRMMDAGVRMGYERAPLAAFFETGLNRNLGEQAVEEKRAMRRRASPIARALAPVWTVEHRLRRLLAGDYRRQSVAYRCFMTEDGSMGRRDFAVDKAPTRWTTRL